MNPMSRMTNNEEGLWVKITTTRAVWFKSGGLCKNLETNNVTGCRKNTTTGRNGRLSHYY
jgi:hypothetical protein